jgi:hypothetical protein
VQDLDLGMRQSQAMTSQAKRPSSCIFSRQVSDWRVNPRLPDMPVPNHYKPRGERSSWTKHQWTVYKEEQAHWREARNKLRAKDQQYHLNGARDSRIRWNRSHKVTYLKATRFVFATVSGRRHGQKPVQLDDSGLPVTEPETSVNVPQIVIDGQSGDKSLQSTVNTIPLSEEPSSPRVDCQLNAVGSGEVEDGKPDAVVDPSVANPAIWEVPDSDEEAEEEPLVRFDDSGRKIPHDYWPSAGRTRGLEDVGSETYLTIPVCFEPDEMFRRLWIDLGLRKRSCYV